MKKKDDASQESVKRRLKVTQKLQEMEELRRVVENIPQEVLDAYVQVSAVKKERPIEEIL